MNGKNITIYGSHKEPKSVKQTMIQGKKYNFLLKLKVLTLNPSCVRTELKMFLYPTKKTLSIVQFFSISAVRDSQMCKISTMT